MQHPSVSVLACLVGEADPRGQFSVHDRLEGGLLAQVGDPPVELCLLPPRHLAGVADGQRHEGDEDEEEAPLKQETQC